ncbi:MAG: hypothetical protein NZ846_01275 [Thermus sp.]|uniref:hypothetical protein n=1 Tax=unclassified Thermus TaxID=2619321 RepID=UPI00023891EE|nr:MULTISPECIES: hypothetical protein [unclassified Thermus]AEV16500.1 hypothetical protein TCCBUS3UF1_14590 [Thermus sp. CCB_US3_UF1]MCS6867640.1 hypothetical protein [Thermus sp.]MCS7217602.1 hypothetical protein [Thermus sp.]MCX7849406.1 hypothetical protein [Thermus sp.]MDW8017646.1 hypothetical protein [Thermus sp.]
MAGGRILPFWAILALLLQGAALPTPKEEKGAGFLAHAPTLALKEDRGSKGPQPLFLPSPKPPEGPARPEEPSLSLPLLPPPPWQALYLLYRRLQLEGG